MKHIVTVVHYNGYCCQYELSSLALAENHIADALRNEYVTKAYIDERREEYDLIRINL